MDDAERRLVAEAHARAMVRECGGVEVARMLARRNVEISRREADRKYWSIVARTIEQPIPEAQGNARGGAHEPRAIGDAT